MLYFEGRISSPEEITIRCCQEHGAVYMADYVLDDSGQLRELRYDRVNFFYINLNLKTIISHSMIFTGNIAL